MSPAPISVVRKVAEVRARVDRVRELLPSDVASFLSERTAAEALILNLYLALQGAADLALHVVSDRGIGVPGDARAAFTALAGAGVIDAALGRRLAAAVGLRNRIAHEYGHLDLALVYRAARDDLGDLLALAAAVARAYDDADGPTSS